jgi:PST family polysaccharide transporter
LPHPGFGHYRRAVAAAEDFKDTVIRGVAWTAVGKTASQASVFVVGILLARLLGPRDFGLIGMGNVVLGFASLFADLGLTSALVQRENLEERHRSSVFWVNLALGILLFGLTALFSGAIADFFREPGLTPVLPAIAFTFVLAPIASVHFSMLSREMHFKRLAQIEILATVLSGATGVGMALAGFGVWSLVTQRLVSSVVSVAGRLAAYRWHPRFVCDPSALRDLLGFSLNLLGFSLLNYWARHLDDLLIGRYMGARALGIYARAYETMMTPVREISGVLSRVMFPSLATIQDDRQRVKAVYVRSLGVIALVTFPFMAIVGAAAEPLVLTLFGRDWHPLVPVLRVVCVAGAFQSLGTTVGWIYQALGRTDVMLRYGAFASAAIAASIVVGVWMGSILSVAVCYTIMTTVVLPYPQFAVPGSLIGMKPIEVLRSVAAPLLVASATAAIVYHADVVLAAHGPLFRVCVEVLLGLSVYLGVLFAWRPGPVRDVLSLIQRRRAGAV